MELLNQTQFVEIVTESRSLNQTWRSSQQTITIAFQVISDPDHPDYIPPSFNYGEFMGDVDDVLVIEKAYTFFPRLKIIPDPDGYPIIMTFDSLRTEQMNNHGWWKCSAEYKHDINEGFGGQQGMPDRPPSEEAEDNVLPQIRMNFTLGGNTVHITKSSQVKSAEASTTAKVANAPDLLGTIGVTKNGITGYDIVDDSLNIQITAYYRPSFINFKFIEKLKHLVGKTNNAKFLGQAPGEVLFLGASGGGAVLDIIPITFDFSIKENVRDKSDDSFPDLTAGGHEVVDYVFMDNIIEIEGFGIELMRPSFRYIHRVYEAASFKVLGFGS